jgi:predicted glycoside hydrolase/deacetylase ChbG (UPF0249 family)
MIDSKTIVLCADDFGMNTGVSQGIIKLVNLERLSAVSCMVNQPDFNLYVKDLFALKNKVQIGLHFNLTDGYLLSKYNRQCFGLNELLVKSHLGLIKPSFIAKEFNAQLDHFTQMMGRMPDFIDGHQHVHQFPQIRRTILNYYEQNLRAHKIYIRSTYPAINLPQFQVKGNLLALTGGKKLHATLKKLTIPHNPYFSGVYNFAKDTDYRTLFRHWLALVPSETLIMCHPGEGLINSDPIAHTRETELNYFLSNEFINDCQEFRTQLMLERMYF